MRRLVSMLAAGAVLVAALAGCVSGQDATNGAVRFVNAVADAPRMSLFLDDKVHAPGFDFNTGSAFVAVPAGQYDARIDAVLPGTTRGSEPTLRNVFEGEIALAVNDELTLVVVGHSGDEETLQIATRTGSVPVGKARVQVVHGAPGGAALDVFVIGSGVSIDVNTVPLAAGLAYKAVTGQQDIDSGSLRFVLTPAAQPQTILLDTGPIFFSAQSTLLFVIVPNVGLDAATRPYSLLAVTGRGGTAFFDVNTPANVRLVNTSPGSYALDVFLNRTVVDNTERQVCDPLTEEDDTLLEACALPFRHVGGFAAIAPGTYDVKAQKTDDAALAARTLTGSFSAGSRSTLILTGLIGAEATDTAVGLQTVPGARRIAEAAQLRIIDLSLAASAAVEGDPTTDRLELYITDADTAFEDDTPAFVGLRVGADTGYLTLVPDTWRLTLARSDTAQPEAPPEILLTQEVSLASAGVYTLVIVDSVGGVAPIAFLPLDDDPTP